MRDEDLDRIWTEYAGPVFRPKWVLPCLHTIARAAAEEEREACIAGVDSVLHQWEMGDPCRNAVLQCMAEISARSRSAAGGGAT